MTAAATLFEETGACWICGGATLAPVHELRFDLHEYERQDPELASYTGQRLALVRCAGCGFAQPAALPTLPDYFDRMYDQRWSEEWIANEFTSAYKDMIFTQILSALGRRVRGWRPRLLDVGSHAGRFLRLARERGWDAEGLELNPKTGAYAAKNSGAAVHHGNVHTFDPGGRVYHAVTMTDVLEHVPHPVPVLERVRALLADGGWVAVKVPNGPVQRRKEHLRARLLPRYRATLADNLVHVNHFSPRALRLALERAGFSDISVVVGAPEVPAPAGAAETLTRAARLAIFRLAALTGAGSSPLAFNLQAYARR